MWKDLKDLLSSVVGTVVTMAMTAATTAAANMELINQALGAIATIVGIITCGCLARVHIERAKLFQQQRVQEANDFNSRMRRRSDDE